MTQNKRIQNFIGELFDNELSQSQCAIVLGEDEKQKKAESPEDFKNEYKCNNSESVGCSSNFRKCTNTDGKCRSSHNAYDCNNSTVS